MNNVFYIQTIRFIVLLLMQILVFSFFPLFHYAYGFLYIFFILFMPFDWPKYVQLLLAFIIGLIIDLFTGTYGIHSILAPIVLMLREPLLQVVLPKFNEEEWKELNLFRRGIFEFSFYSFVMSFIACSIFFALNFFNSKSLLQMMLYIGSSTIFTFILLFIYRYLFANTRGTNE